MKLNILTKPIITEKTSRSQENGIYTFVVVQDATKIDIKNAFEALYGEKVEKVQILYVKPKVKMVGSGKPFTKRAEVKKAVIKVTKGKKVDILKFEKPKK